MELTVPVWPSTAGAAKPGIRSAGSTWVASPISPAAPPQPEPRTRATSWLATEVSAAMKAAASAARAKGSVVTGPNLPAGTAGLQRLHGSGRHCGLRHLRLLRARAGLRRRRGMRQNELVTTQIDFSAPRFVILGGG